MLTNIMKWGPNIMKMAQHNEIQKKGPKKVPVVAQFWVCFQLICYYNIMIILSVVQASDKTK